MKNKTNQTAQPIKDTKKNWTPKDHLMLEEQMYFRQRKQDREQLYFYELTK
jgi:hypothetical protein